MSKARLGQHFLINPDVANRQIKYADLSSKDWVLEVGPGKGALTFLLAKYAGKVFAIEKDKSLYQDLLPKLPSNVKLIHGDILSIDDLMNVEFSKVVSNLPYQISSPFTFWLLRKSFSRAVLMYQKEFADRMAASVGSPAYSRLSVSMFYFAHCNILETVSRHNFSPKPSVDSCIVEIILRKKPPFSVKNESFFFELVTHLFNHRRKQIKNTVQHVYGFSIGDLSIATKRVESLPPAQIGKLSDLLFDRLKQ